MAEGRTAGRPVVVLTDETVHPDAMELLARSCELRVLAGSYPTEERLIAACRDADAILARLGDVTRRVLQAAPRLRIVARHGVGVDAVDLEAAAERGVMVTTTGAANAAAVAEYSFALLLALARKIPLADEGMRKGNWERGPLLGAGLAGRTLGIVGLGATGRLMARYGLGFGMQVLARTPSRPVPSDLDVIPVGFGELLERADILSLHLRLSGSTRRILEAGAIARMKPGALVVNTSRGELIDEAALVAALRDGRLGGAALDVFEREPLPADSPLRAMTNVVLSPHVAGQTTDAVRRVGLAAADAILAALAGRIPDNLYNADALRKAGHLRS